MDPAVSEVLLSLRYVFFPRRCAFCARVIRPGESVCRKCRGDILRVKPPICYACGRNRAHCVCGRAHDRFVAACAAPFYYLGYGRDAVLRLKFKSETEIAETLGAEMADYVLDVYSGISFDLVTFVPMTEQEFRKRGFNQSELLARAAVLCKLFDTPRQHDLHGRYRSGNVLGVFDVSSPVSVRGKRILLCDDLRTTGSTLSECAKMLILHGAREVFCLTAAVSFSAFAYQQKG